MGKELFANWAMNDAQWRVTSLSALIHKTAVPSIECKQTHFTTKAYN